MTCLLFYFLPVLLTLDFNSAMEAKVKNQYSSDATPSAFTITCTPKPTGQCGQSVILMRLAKPGGRGVASIRGKDVINYGYLMEASVKAVGHIDGDPTKSFLSVTFTDAVREDSGLYTCSVMLFDRSGLETTDTASVNVSVGKTDVQDVVRHVMARMSLLDHLFKTNDGTLQADMSAMDASLALQTTRVNTLYEKDQVQETTMNSLLTVVTSHRKTIGDQERKLNFLQESNEDHARQLASLGDNNAKTGLNNLQQRVADQTRVLEDLESRLKHLEEVTRRQEQEIISQKEVNKRQRRRLILIEDMKGNQEKPKTDNQALETKLEALEKTNEDQETKLKAQEEAIRQIKNSLVVSSYRTAFSSSYNRKDKFRANATLIFSDSIFDIGNAYNTITGVFTAPMRGLYVFHLTLLTFKAKWRVDVDLMVNDRAVASLNAMDEDSADQSSISTVVSLEAGDEVKPVMLYIKWGIIVHPADHFSIFSGYLLHQLQIMEKK